MICPGREEGASGGERIMRVLLVGSGGREHALAWKLSQSPQVSAIYVAPGNGGTATLAKTQNVATAAEDVDGLAELAARQRIDLTVVGPEAPLVAGLVERAARRGLAALAQPAAAQIEGSKVFAKRFMQETGIPTGEPRSFAMRLRLRPTSSRWTICP